MDRINDPPATRQDALTDNDHGILGSAGQNEGSKDDEDRILGGAPQAPGLTPGETAQIEPNESEPDAEQTPLDSGERAGGRLDSDAVGTGSPHTDTGAGSNNLTSVGGNRS